MYIDRVGYHLFKMLCFRLGLRLLYFQTRFCYNRIVVADFDINPPHLNPKAIDIPDLASKYIGLGNFWRNNKQIIVAGKNYDSPD